MEKEFIPYEQTLALKELGFNETNFECFKHWVHYGDYNYFLILPKPKNSYDYISAPLYQQAFRWFREKYKLSGETQSYQFKYSYLIIYDTLGDNTCKKIKYDFDSYEEAELECLKKLIEIAQNK